MFDIVNTSFNHGRAFNNGCLLISSSFSKAQDSTLHVIKNAHTVFLQVCSIHNFNVETSYLETVSHVCRG